MVGNALTVRNPRSECFPNFKNVFEKFCLCSGYSSNSAQLTASQNCFSNLTDPKNHNLSFPTFKDSSHSASPVFPSCIIEINLPCVKGGRNYGTLTPCYLLPQTLNSVALRSLLNSQLTTLEHHHRRSTGQRQQFSGQFCGTRTSNAPLLGKPFAWLKYFILLAWLDVKLASTRHCCCRIVIVSCVKLQTAWHFLLR